MIMSVKILIQSNSGLCEKADIRKVLPEQTGYEFIENLEKYDFGNLIIFTDSINPFFIKKWGNKNNVFFFYLSREKLSIPNDLLELSNFGGVFNPTHSLSNYKSQLSLIFKHFDNEVQFKDYRAAGKSIENQIRDTKEEVDKLKKIYRKLVPLRVNSWKHFKFTSKFQAGMNTGGEFFDYKISENHISFYSISTTNSEQLIDFISLMENNSIKRDLVFQEDFIGADLLFLELELSTLKVNTLMRGGGEVIYQGKPIKISAGETLKLRPGQELYILSKGLIENLGESYQRLDFNKELSLEDFFDEVFLKTMGERKYLDFDGFMLNIQVGKNALFKV